MVSQYFEARVLLLLLLLLNPRKILLHQIHFATIPKNELKNDKAKKYS